MDPIHTVYKTAQNLIRGLKFNLKNLNILVSGAGSGVGQSIIRSLKISKLKINLYSCDINEVYKNIYNVKKFFLIPKVEEKNSKKKILSIFKKNKIDIFFCGSEFEISYFAKNKNYFELNSSVKICVSREKTIKIANDKYLTYEFLKKNKLPYPKTSLIKKKCEFYLKKFKFPFILKDRFGTSSRNVFIIKNIKEFKFYLSLIKKPIIQEYLKFDSITNKKNYSLNEYTCSFFSDLNGKRMGIFIAERSLRNGHSWVINHQKPYPKKLKDLITKISNKIDNIGSFNIQLIKTKKEYIPFEFNSRFSGTTSVRASFGFNEPEMFILQIIKNNNKKITQKTRNGKIIRYIDEIEI